MAKTNKTLLPWFQAMWMHQIFSTTENWRQRNSTFVRLCATSASFVTTGGATSSGVCLHPVQLTFLWLCEEATFQAWGIWWERSCCQYWILAVLSWILVYFDTGVLVFQLSLISGTWEDTSCCTRPLESLTMMSLLPGGGCASSWACIIMCMEPFQSGLQANTSQHTPMVFCTQAQKLAARLL